MLYDWHFVVQVGRNVHCLQKKTSTFVFLHNS